ncbi:fungal-specific transcription factor [Penicillium argentinense]|uniref:Fungal-specific transcription factor n=1 Tax=Penicillium argentinense TaxID=1131581 RepID=A0A9W9EJT2_9EURO|nr:fungal-specific transcription factor [Penicillium argentinense]KAJ5083093.1 fungal-specific transcription factor [Penicillium argentinense]
METILIHTIEGIDLDTKNLARMAEEMKSGVPTQTEVLSQDPNSGEAERLEINEGCTIDPVEETTTHFSGEFSYWNFTMRIKEQIKWRMDNFSSHVRCTIEPVTFVFADQLSQSSDSLENIPGYWRAQQLSHTYDRLSEAISSLPPRDVMLFLVGVFYKYNEPFCLFIQNQWVIDQIKVLSSRPQTVYTAGDEVAVSIILSILAIGSQYAHLESPRRKEATFAASEFSEEHVGATFYRQAIRYLPEIIELSSLESVQACLLLGIYSIPVDASGLGYIYISLSVRLAMQNGMHRRPRDDAFDNQMKEIRNRIWWTAYSLERKLSIFHGRPLSVNRRDVDADMPQDYTTELDGESGQVFYLLSSVRMMDYLESLYEQICHIRRCPGQKRSVIMAHVLRTRESLVKWMKATDESLAMPMSSAHRSSMHLRLEYCLVRMFAGRPFMLAKGQPSTATTSAGSEHQSRDEWHHNERESHNSPLLPQNSRDFLTNDCIQASQEALEICSQLQQSFPGLARASYIEYSSCRAALLVLIAFSIQSPSNSFQEALRKGMAMIKEMSIAGDSARSEVSLIEALERALFCLQSRAKDSKNDMNNTKTAYDLFKEWGKSKEAQGHKSARKPSTPSIRQGWEPGLPSVAPPSSNPGLTQSLPCYFEKTNLSPSVGPGSEVSIRQGDGNIEYLPCSENDISPFLEWPLVDETQVLEQFLSSFPSYVS